MALVFFALLFVLTIAVLLIRQLSRVISLSQLTIESPAVQRPRIIETVVSELGPARSPIASVTDHTTRTLDPVYKERDTQRS